jgi:DNA-binding MarR family transcriptional regulator
MFHEFELDSILGKRIHELTGAGKGSLSNHLEKLEASGYIQTRSIMKFGGPRVEVRITDKGREVYDNLVKALARLGR